MEYMRDNLEDSYNIIQLQNSILQIANYIDEICLKNDIKYFLMGGSALGAIRHGGFIPWDDDLDIFMMPVDYEKFRSICQKEGVSSAYYLQELICCDGMVASAKLRLNNSTYIEEATKDWDIHQGIFVDIFILHNCPHSAFFQFLQCMAAKYILIKEQGWKNAKYCGFKGIIVGIFRVMPKNLGIKTALKILYSFNSKQTEYVCHFMGKAFYKKGIYKKVCFENPVRVPFEKIKLNAPSNTDEYLRKRFGDYIKLPPTDSIKQAQHALIWDTEMDYSIYLNRDKIFQ